MKAKIKHVAFMSHNAPRLCRFYECLFGLTRARAESSPASEEEFAMRFGYPLLSTKRAAKPYDSTVIAGDGNIGVAFLRRRPGYPAGIDHFGIEVDDLDGVFSRYKEKYLAIGFVKRPSNRPFASFSSHDPEGHLFDLTQPGMDNIRGVWGESARQQERYIKHLTIRALNAAALARFYVDVFEFKEEEKALEDPNFYLTDGAVTLVLTPWKIEDYENAEHRGPGLDHVGFKVEDLKTFQSDFQILTNTDPEWMVPKAPNLASEHDVVLRLLSACRYGQNQLADPDGNFIDVTDR